MKDGFKAGLAFTIPTFALGASFGVLAQPVMGSTAAIVMSVVVFGGAAQFASVTVLAASGGVASAVSAGLLINGRFLPMGLALAPALRGGPLRAAVGGPAVVGASWAPPHPRGGPFGPGLVVRAPIPPAGAGGAGPAGR